MAACLRGLPSDNRQGLGDAEAAMQPIAPAGRLLRAPCNRSSARDCNTGCKQRLAGEAAPPAPLPRACPGATAPRPAHSHQPVRAAHIHETPNKRDVRRHLSERWCASGAARPAEHQAALTAPPRGSRTRAQGARSGTQRRARGGSRPSKPRSAVCWKLQRPNAEALLPRTVAPVEAGTFQATASVGVTGGQGTRRRERSLASEPRPRWQEQGRLS